MEVPQQIQLAQNYPNPFNPTTAIGFYLVEPGAVRLTVHNQQGQLIATLVNSNLPVGEHEVDFNGSGLPSGVYIYTLISGQERLSRRMTLLK